MANKIQKVRGESKKGTITRKSADSSNSVRNAETLINIVKVERKNIPEDDKIEKELGM